MGDKNKLLSDQVKFKKESLTLRDKKRKYSIDISQ